MTRLRIATFNLESLDAGPDVIPPLAERIAVLRPLLRRLDADVFCLQEVNGQENGRHMPRRFAALEALLEGTPYADFARASTESARGGPADVHNLVILSRWPIVERRQVRHDLVSPPAYRPATAQPPADAPAPVEWDRPLLYARLAVPRAPALHVINLHLRAPLAAFIPGQKLAPFVWKSVAGWADGFYLAAMKRTGQALEARLLVDRLFDSEPDALVAIAGDLNAEARETPVRVIYGDTEDTGNPALAARMLSPIENAVPQDKRFSVLHHGLKLMLDHMLVSPALARAHTRSAILNETLADEYHAYLTGAHPPESFHAPIVANFKLPEA